MTRYEILMLATPAITQDEAGAIEKNLEGMIKKAKGEVISFERWGKCRLSYPVRHNDYGVYFLTRFEVEKNAQLFEEIKTAFAVKHNEIVMRHVLVKLDEEQSLEYRRPQTVEDAPTRDVDSFLRENKMEGLISSDKKTAAPVKEEAVATEAKPEFVSLDALDDKKEDAQEESSSSEETEIEEPKEETEGAE